MTTLPSQFQQYDARAYPRRRLAARQAKTSSIHVYEVPSDKAARIDTMFFASAHSGTVLLRVHHVRPGESAGADNALYYDLSISAKTTTIVDATIWMVAGDRLVVSADSADKVVVTIYGEES
jgi:hypothetical protein